MNARIRKWQAATCLLGAIVFGMIVQPAVAAWVADNQRKEIEQIRIDARLAVACTDKTNEPVRCLEMNNLGGK